VKATWHVALLRGINVGRAKRVAMADLRALIFEAPRPYKRQDVIM
jgi:uncharacterized protein (DUF1697 family)